MSITMEIYGVRVVDPNNSDPMTFPLAPPRGSDSSSSDVLSGVTIGKTNKNFNTVVHDQITYPQLCYY